MTADEGTLRERLPEIPWDPPTRDSLAALVHSYADEPYTTDPEREFDLRLRLAEGVFNWLNETEEP